MDDFIDHVALVTGGGSGLGATISRELASRGAAVMVTDINESTAAQVAEEIVKAGGRASSMRHDTADLKSHEAVVAETARTFGNLTLAVNNAGIGTPAGAIGEMGMSAWDRLIAINLNGVAYGLRHQIPSMLANGGGSTVNMASILGSVGAVGVPGSYVAAKHGVVGLTKIAALEYAQQGIRVNSVGPAFIKTPLLGNLPEAALPE